MKTIISEEQAIELLKRAIERAGSAVKLAAELEVSPAFISRSLTGAAPITGKLAQYLKLRSINGYELTLIEDSPEQERYANARRAWLEQNGLDPYDQTGIRGIAGV